jgi:hypothetical protein
VGDDDRHEVVGQHPGQDVLVDRHPSEVAESLLVALGHHDLVAFAGPPDHVRALDRGAGRTAADHAALLEHGLDLAMSVGTSEGVDDPPFAVRR